MPRVLLNPRYSHEYRPHHIRPCTPEIAATLEAKAKQIAAETAQVEYIDVTLMTQPRKRDFLARSLYRPSRKLMALTREGKLKLTQTHVRTFGISPDGHLFIGREYAGIRGMVFVSLHPLLQCPLDIDVLEGELVPALDKMLA